MSTDPGPVAILAGSGALPVLLADRLSAEGRACRILAFRGFADRALRRRADAVVGLLDVRRSAACLEAWQPAAVTLAGGLRRPSAAAAVDAFSAFRNRDELARVLERGDDNLLGAVAALLEERGLRLVGIRDLAPDLLARPGAYGRLRPAPDGEAAIRRGLALLGDLSGYDVGQAVALEGERVLAIEGPEGTDAMLGRVRALRTGWLGRRRGSGGVLVKAPKTGQDLRIDLPAIGPRTVVNAARAGLAGIAVASGLTLVLDVPETVAAADRLGLFLWGIGAGEGAPA